MGSAAALDLTETLERVLSEPRFQAPAESWWDRLLARLVSEIARLIAAVIEAVGGPVIAATIALAFVGLVVTVVVFRLAGRRATEIAEREHLARLIERGANPDEFLRRAEDASRAGEHRQAVRYRFVGGVLDMARRKRIRYEPGLTTAGIVAQVDDPGFADLASQFDAVVYGGRDATEADDRASRETWDRLRSTT
ncbi:MAG: DUF4129 domain-containing protein [Acidimicrobiia bacterium]|nr:DUF4129 domain-containing protein [Acidimicrobiia bacterium]